MSETVEQAASLYCCRILYWSHFLNWQHTTHYMLIWLMLALYQLSTGFAFIPIFNVFSNW